MRHAIKKIAKGILPESLYLKTLFRYHHTLGNLETEMIFIDRFVKNHHISVDVGANSGLYSLYLSRKFKKVYAFEPVAELYDRLLKSKLKNTQVFNVALSENNEDKTLYIPVSDKTTKNTEASLVNRADNAIVKKVNIACRTLDSFDITDLSFMKIDVEGHELEVIKGSTETIKKYSPTLLVEIEQRWQMNNTPISETFKYLKDLGYSGHFIKNKKIYNLTEFDVQRDQIDILCSGEIKRELESSYVNNFFFTKEL
jgi:FkbM family methyltransferase